MRTQSGRVESSLWDHCQRLLRQQRCDFRLYRHPKSPYLWIKERSGRRFSLAPLRVDVADDLRQAAELCQQAHIRGRWSEPQPPGARGPVSWAALATLVEQRVIEQIPKEGSRVHLLNDLRHRIAKLPGVPTAEALEAWALELDPASSLRSFNRRLEVLSQIQRNAWPELAPVLERLRNLRPRGAAVRLARAQRQRVRLVPSDEAIEAWLDDLDPFNQWVYAVLAIYGLRPHELWHAEVPDEKGWITIPGEMQTKSARAHFAPPVPARWLERYWLRELWNERQAELRQRWPIRWQSHGAVRIPTNNAALGQYLYKQFALRGVPKLIGPLADDGAASDWCRPYDLRHAYAIRCATSAETAQVFPEQQAEWLGHTWAVHQQIYLRWLPDSRKRQALQRQLDAASTPAPPDTAALEAELAALKARFAALQDLLSGPPGP